MALNSALLRGFVETFLRPQLDNPHPIPPCHVEWWDMCCSEEPNVAIAAPRGHAKSTAVTHSYTLAAMLFRQRDFALIVSSTETMAVQFLNDIKAELNENAALREAFGVQRFIREAEADIIVQLDTGRFRIMAKGVEQKVRGLKWRGKRPNLVICDDMEEDEQVESKERRDKLRNWFLKALLPAGGDNCLFRVVGTIMHDDSLLKRLLEDKMWLTRIYSAHNEDFSEILWPEKFPRERLLAIRSTYHGDMSAYSQEYLNQPIHPSDSYFQKSWFRRVRDEDRRADLTYYIGSDLAIGKDRKNDYTVFAIVGVNPVGKLFLMDIVRGKWDGMEIVDKLFELYLTWKPYVFGLEGGQIEKAIMPYINAQMLTRRLYPNVRCVSHGNKDKETRAKPIQAMMRSGALLFDMEAEWFDDYQDEMLRFPKSKHDDQVDATSIIGALLEMMAVPGVTQPTLAEEEEAYFSAGNLDSTHTGRSAICGY